MLAIPLIGTFIALLTIAGLWTQYSLQQRESSQKEVILAPFRELASKRYPNAQSPEEAMGLLARDSLGLPELILLPQRTLRQHDAATGIYGATYIFRSRHNTALSEIKISMRFGSPIASAASVMSLTSVAVSNIRRSPVLLDEDKHGLSYSTDTLPAGAIIEIHVESRHPLPNEPEVNLQPSPTTPNQ